MEEQNQSYRQREDEIANYLAADRAAKSAEQRMSPDYDPDTIPETNEQQSLTSQKQTQPEANQLAMASSKQRQLRQIQQEINASQKQLSDLEIDFNDFKKSRLGGFLSIFQPRINWLIDNIIEQLKKQTRKLSDEAKVSFYTGAITTAISLIGILKSLKFIAAFLDAAFIISYSCFRLVISTFFTCIIPIILIIIAPIYIPFLAVLILIGKIPLAKGALTKNITELIEQLKKQKDVWQKELDLAKKRVALRRRIKELKKAQKQIAQQN